jgi:WD40 repeat protein/predicted Ser/Thr protein kinase
MTATPTNHPSPEELIAFAGGQLGDAAARAVAAHLADCLDCRRAARTLPPAPGETQPVLPPRDGTRGPDARPPSAPAAALPPELANHPRYRILRELGRGGMGVVYHAEQTLMDRQVAIKVINKALLDRPDFLERFQREVKAAAKLAHPNIVTAHDAEQLGGLHLLVMEFVPGRSLAAVLAKKGPLPVAHACHYTRQAALGLQHAHEHGMVHRDIKPHNLMLTPKGTVKILDFGLAKMVSEQGRGDGLTATGTYMGTPEYSAPEQADDAHRADIRADVYSLGCTLYALLAGRPPFREKTDFKTILAHVEQAPPPLPGLRPAVPAALWAVVAKMLAKKPEDRYQTPSEVAAALAPFCRPGTKVNAGPAPAAADADETLPVAKVVGADAAASPGVPAWLRRWPARAWSRLRPLPAAAWPRLRAVPARVWRLPAAVRVGTAVVVLLLAAWLGAQAIIREWKRQPPVAPVSAGSTREPEPEEGLLFTLAGHTGLVQEVVFRPDGKRLASASEDQTVKVWDVDTRQEVLTLRGHKGAVRGVCWSPGSNRLATASDDQTVKVWDAETGEELFTLRGSTPEVLSVCWNPDGNRLASAGTDKTVKVWDVQTQEVVHTLEGHTDWVRCVRWSPDGERLASAGDDQVVRVWDAGSGLEFFSLAGHTGWVRGVGWSPDSKYLASAGQDKTVRVWDAAGVGDPRTFEGHADIVHGVSWNPDGKRLASASADRTVKVWDVDAGKVDVTFLGHTDAVWGVCWSPDGRRLASAGADHVVKVWAVRPKPDAPSPDP